MAKALSAGYCGVLVLLLRLHQCCEHLHLLEKGMIGSDSGMEDLVRRRSTATDSENRMFLGLTVSSVVCNEVLLDTLQVG